MPISAAPSSMLHHLAARPLLQIAPEQAMGCEETGEILGEKLHDPIAFANIAGAALWGPLGIVMRDLRNRVARTPARGTRRVRSRLPGFPASAVRCVRRLRLRGCAEPRDQVAVCGPFGRAAKDRHCRTARQARKRR